VNSIEGGLTNVCGLATESALARLGFDYDAVAATIPSLHERLSPLTRQMKWLSTGPLIFSNRLDDPPSPRAYYAGDALSFVDPFTGSGLYCAVLTGEIAGNSAALAIPPAEHVNRCGQALGRPFAFATLFRNAITAGWAQHMAPMIPARVLYRLTRPASHRRSH
jgi:hypothetical protein